MNVPLPADEARARFLWNGVVYRAYEITDADDADKIGVRAVRLTKKGADFKRGLCCVWLTLRHSLDKNADYASLAAYVREFVQS